MSASCPAVYTAIVAVMADLAKDGIGKDRRSQQGYNFRGIDDVYNALAPALSRHNLAILPRIMTRAADERETKNGGRMCYVVVEAEFDLVSSLDGSKHTVRSVGEAMDSADKATNKAMSAAFKYAAFQTFCIPTEGDNDADAVTPEVKPAAGKDAPAAKRDPAPTAPPPAAEPPAPTRDARAIHGSWGLSKDQTDGLKAACKAKGLAFSEAVLAADAAGLSPDFETPGEFVRSFCDWLAKRRPEAAHAA